MCTSRLSEGTKYVEPTTSCGAADHECFRKGSVRKDQTERRSSNRIRGSSGDRGNYGKGRRGGMVGHSWRSPAERADRAGDGRKPQPESRRRAASGGPRRPQRLASGSIAFGRNQHLLPEVAWRLSELEHLRRKQVRGNFSHIAFRDHHISTRI